MIRVKKFIKQILFRLMNIYLSIRKDDSNVHSADILLIRLDSLGDYILFRNFISELRNSSRFTNCKITLLGNINWKELAENLDGKYIDKFIWIDVNNTLMNLKKRFVFLNEISKQKFQYLINPAISRSFYTDDSIAKVSNSNLKIGCTGDYANSSVFQKKKSDDYYDELIKIDDIMKFEFYRNKEFFEKLLRKKIDIDKPFINISEKKIEEFSNKDYALIVPGAGNPKRQWNMENFGAVIKHLLNEYNMEIYITGTKLEKNLVDRLIEINKSDRVHSLVGNIDSMKLAQIIKRAKIMVSNETGPVHFAALLNIKTICISTGNTLYRFNPYPEEISSSIKYIYPEIIKENLNNQEKLKKFWMGSDLEIDLIDRKEVIKEIDNILS